MEREEFKEILLQSLGGIKGGKPVRLTLVKPRNELLLKKLKEMQYIDTRSIPFQNGYRFIVSSFTHGQYSKFRTDYWDDMDFLSVPYDDFTAVTKISEDHGFELHGFSATGKGRIQEDFPDAEAGTALKNLNHYLSMDYRPYLLKFRKGGVSIQIRKDFNFFFRRVDEDSIDLIYDTVSGILSKREEFFENLIKLRFTTDTHGNNLNFIPVEVFKRLPGISDDTITGIVRSSSGTVSMSGPASGYIIHYSIGESEKSEGKILVDPESITFIPHWNSRIESAVRILESLRLGGVITW